MAFDEVQAEVLASLQNVVPLPLTHTGFSIASDTSPWRERECEREAILTMGFSPKFG